MPDHVHLVLVPPDADSLRRALATFWVHCHRNLALNDGGCFSYALALTRGEPLLFKGGDFAMTDIGGPGESARGT